MARYFFALHDQSGDTPDREGCELSDAAAARRHALMIARGLMAEDIRGGQLTLSDYIQVTDGRGEVILTLPFSSAVMIQP